ncbi:MAG: glycyl-radical enzyme activating protein [Desulfobacteraceae bacterium]|nr:MAG: glycyl-radical enzyme activating protein [Desulfobacteraceae bacterium]
MKAVVFNIQRYSIHDGPGIRTTLFFKGCPLSCLWCSNPEGISPDPQIIVRRSKCIRSRSCGEACRKGALRFTSESKPDVSWTECDQCLDCAAACPSGAIGIAGKEMDIEEVIVSALSDGAFYRNSGGGVTASGGEPLHQWRFVKELFERLQAKGIHTTLDTSGYAAWEVIEEVLPHTNLVLYDLKHMDRLNHERATGRDNSLILSNAMSMAGKVRIWFRVPLIPGFNDTVSNLEETAKFAAFCKADKISLLVYHELGKHKYGQIGRPFALTVEKPEGDGWVRDAFERISRCRGDVEVNA